MGEIVLFEEEPRNNELKKIENLDTRLITFSKRRANIYKNASELSILCGAKIGILVYSPTGKPFTFGIPTFDTIQEYFRDRNYPTLEKMPSSFVDAYWNAKYQETSLFSNEYEELSSRLLKLEKEGVGLAKEMKNIQDECWWDACVEDLNANQMDQHCESLQQLKRHVAQNNGTDNSMQD